MLRRNPITLTRRFSFPLSPPLLLLSSSSSASFPNPNPSFYSPFSVSASSMATAKPAPPVAKKAPHKMELFGEVRVDNYYWMRDDSRSDPDVLAHLKAENNYTALIMSDVKQVEDQIYSEMRARIKEDDISAPVRKGNYYYYERTLTGKEYVQRCRRLVPAGTSLSPSVHDMMPTDSTEHVILDENVKAKGHDYYSIESFKVSPDNNLVAYAEDTKGDEIYSVYVINAETGDQIEK